MKTTKRLARLAFLIVAAIPALIIANAMLSRSSKGVEPGDFR